MNALAHWSSAYLTISCEKPKSPSGFLAPQDLKGTVGLFHGSTHIVPSLKQYPLRSMLISR